MTAKSDTPRTDARVFDPAPGTHGHEWVYASDAKELERSLCAAEAECRALREDAARLDWLEQQIETNLVLDLVQKWTFNDRRYPTGMRGAIDAAIAAAKTSPDDIQERR